MTWLRRLLQPITKPTETKDTSLSESRPRSMFAVEFDASTVTKSVKADLRRNIGLLDDIDKKHARQIYEAALRSVSAGRDLHVLYTALMNIEGMSKDRAADIARSLNNKASAIIDRERQASLGITHATWMYASTSCMVNPFASSPTASEVQQDSAHREANGKRYEIKRGLFVDGKWTWPGFEDGCKCVSRAIIPGLEKYAR